jgi:hypothetical protein
MNRCLFLWMGVLCAIFTACQNRGSSTHGDRSLISNAETNAEQRTHDLLQKQIEINYHDRKLAEVIDDVRQKTGANIFVNWNALTEAGIERDTPIELNLAGLKAERVLALVIKTVSRDDRPIDYEIAGGVVKIDTVENIVRQDSQQVRVYDVSDLLKKISFQARYQDCTSDELTTAMERRREVEENLILLIETCVGEQEDWMGAGGPGQVHILGDLLIVRTSVKLHREVADFLRLLRQ